jgi:hypothetical protein
MFDEAGNILFVFDNQHAVLLHVVQATLVVRGFASMSKLLNLGYRSRVSRVILRMSLMCR